MKKAKPYNNAIVPTDIFAQQTQKVWDLKIIR
jgi:hypothetical protein